MQSFLRVTKLHNVQGRAAYIADERRQEQILVSMATDEILQVGWKAIAEFERSHRRSQEANNEAREIVIQLPNSWATLPNSFCPTCVLIYQFMLLEKTCRLSSLPSTGIMQEQTCTCTSSSLNALLQATQRNDTTATSTSRKMEKSLENAQRGLVTRTATHFRLSIAKANS